MSKQGGCSEPAIGFPAWIFPDRPFAGAMAWLYGLSVLKALRKILDLRARFFTVLTSHNLYYVKLCVYMPLQRHYLADISDVACRAAVANLNNKSFLKHFV